MAAGVAPALAATGGRGPSLCFSRSSKSWAEEEEDGPMELPVSLAPPQLGVFLAAARPARRGGRSAAKRRSLPDQRPLPPPAEVPRPTSDVVRPAAPHGLSPTVVPGSGLAVGCSWSARRAVVRCCAGNEAAGFEP
ncbi:hypothetical protein ZWY2020_001424 [Hordeum vulgare]|nr:hypothetical protein ZWY2020_001424 [Hordeum vulgare]